MGTISIHGISPKMEKVLKDKAKEKHLSVSGFIKEILENSLLRKKKADKNKKYFKKFSNTWTETEYQEFNAATSDFEQIHPEDLK
ncbi:MAG: hypothetical protein JXJ04_03010 [Spirochaetales bacterium]|nr:hypothetical protein [Spirochaetales bacterium]